MNDITLMFGKRIRSLRQSQNISQEKLAEFSGLHPTYIGQIERGEKSPTLDSIYKLAEGLNTDINKLFYNISETIDNKDDFVVDIYNQILSLPDEKKKTLCKIINDIINM